MSDSLPKSLRLLRESSGFVDALTSSRCAAEALRPYAHLLRDLCDPRTRGDKIRDAFVSELGAMSSRNRSSEVAEILCKRISFRLDRYALSDVPCYATALSFAESRYLGGQVSDSALGSAESSS